MIIKKQTKIMCFGTFDGLHLGHLSYFKQAKKHGDYLIVIVALDASVLKIKGHKPKFFQTQRLQAVQNCPLVNEARLGQPGDHLAVIRKFKPDVICLGYDQQADVSKLHAKFPNIKIVRLKPYKPKIYKSSIINNKRQKSNDKQILNLKYQ